MKTSISLAKQCREILFGELGQATAEYALMTSFMLLGAGVGSYWFLYKSLMDAYNSYMGSIHFVLNLALP